MVLRLTQAAAHGLPLAATDLDYSYTPGFLLSAPFKRSIVEHGDFCAACEEGFISYFENLISDDEQGREVFIKQGYTWDEVIMLLVEWVDEFNGAWVLATSLAWLAGFGLGWLSALAVFRREDAQRALVVLAALLGPAVGLKEASSRL